MSRTHRIVVAQHGFWFGSYEIDPQTGKVLRHRRLASREHQRWGVAGRCAGRMVVVFKRPSDAHVILRVGRTVLDLNAPLEPARVSYTSTRMTSRLRVSTAQGGFSIGNFTPGRVFWPLIDPTWDGIDDDSEDFLIQVTSTLKRAAAGNLECDVWPFRLEDHAR